MSLPGISCYCNTYGRPHILEEAVESFLRQDYQGPKELVILNDCAEQELIFDHPEVRIFNINRRISPLGRKFNISITKCQYDILACWEDDDIYLPRHLSTAMQYYSNGMFHTKFAWFQTTASTLVHTFNYYHASHVFAKDLFVTIGGYKDTDQRNLDQDLMTKFENIIGNYHIKLEPAELTYIYRWSTTNSYHGSQWSDLISLEAEKYITTSKSNGTLPTGRIELKPAWRVDYINLIPKE